MDEVRTFWHLTLSCLHMGPVAFKSDPVLPDWFVIDDGYKGMYYDKESNAVIVHTYPSIQDIREFLNGDNPQIVIAMGLCATLKDRFWDTRKTTRFPVVTNATVSIKSVNHDSLEVARSTFSRVAEEYGCFHPVPGFLPLPFLLYRLPLTLTFFISHF